MAGKHRTVRRGARRAKDGRGPARAGVRKRVGLGAGAMRPGGLAVYGDGRGRRGRASLAVRASIIPVFRAGPRRVDDSPSVGVPLDSTGCPQGEADRWRAAENAARRRAAALASRRQAVATSLLALGLPEGVGTSRARTLCAASHIRRLLTRYFSASAFFCGGIVSSFVWFVIS